MIKKALILAAGLGSRLKHMTEEIPKALIKANNIPILQRQIDALLENKIETVNIVCGYKKNKILEFIDYQYGSRDLEFNFIFNNDYDSTNSAYSYWLAYKEMGSEDYIHLNCDNILGSDVIYSLKENASKNLIVGRSQMLADNMEQVELDQDNKILKMDNKNFSTAMKKAMGVAKISSKLSDDLFIKIDKQIREGTRNTNFYGAIRESVNHHDIHCIDLSDKIFEVNTLDEYEIMHKG